MRGIIDSVPNSQGRLDANEAGSGLLKISRMYPGPSLLGLVQCEPAGLSSPIGHIVFFPASCIALPDPLNTSGHPVQTATFRVNIF